MKGNFMTPRQRRNSKILLQVIENKIEKKHPREVLNSYLSPCKTYGCILGDYVLTKKGQAHERGVLIDECCRIEGQFEDEFGFSEYFDRTKETSNFYEKGDVIGMDDSGSLAQRRDYVKEMLRTTETSF